MIILKELQVELVKRLKEHDLKKIFVGEFLNLFSCFFSITKNNLLLYYTNITICLEVEIPIQRCLLSMELTGIGFDLKVVNNLWSLSTELMGTLEIAAFTLAKQKFSLNSNVEFSKACEVLIYY